MVSLAAQANDTVNLGVYAWRPKEDLVARWTPLAKYLSAALGGREVRLSVYEESALEAALDRREIDFLFTNPRHYVKLRYRREMSGALASLVEVDQGRPVAEVAGAILTRADHPDIRTLADLRGKRVAVFGRAFLGGYLAQAHTLARAGVFLPGDVTLIDRKMSQEEILQQVQAGEVDAGFVKAGMLEEYARQGRFDPSRFRVVGAQNHPGFPWGASTDLYPNWPFVALKHVDRTVAAEVAGALLRIRPDDPVAVNARIYGFSVPGDYTPVEEVLRQLRLPPFDQPGNITPLDLWQEFRVQAMLAGAAFLLIAALGAGLAARTLQLSRSRQALEEHKAELEQNVEARTAELRNLHRQFDSFMEMGTGAFAIVGLDGRVKYLNRGFEEYFGYTLADLPNIAVWWEKAYPDPVYRADRQSSWEHLLAEARVTGQGIKAFEGHVCCKSGRYVWVDAYAHITADQVNIALVDTSLRKTQALEIETLNRELAQKARDADAANIAKSRFLANMSHEIRTPLNAILGFTHLLRLEENNPKQKDRLERIASASEHLLAVINDILDLSKIEADKLSLEMLEFNVADVLHRVTDIIAFKAQSKGLELLVDARDLPERLIGDPTRLSQVLINFLGNAIKFTDKGYIVLRAQLVSQAGEAVLLRFEVEDTGIGIAREQRANIFDAFEQATTATTRHYGGTGLGLAINKRLAELMHGEVGVISTLGEGSLFWMTGQFSLPAADAPPALPPPPFAGLRALVIDDLPITRMIHQQLLRRLGFETQVLNRGNDAAHVVLAAHEAGAPIDFVFLDYFMPGLDGLETLAKIRALLLPRKPTFVMATSSNDVVLHESAREAGCAAVLCKPLDLQGLQHCLEQILQAPAGTADGAPALRPVEVLQRDFTGRHVLLAEDEPINQMIAEELLHMAGLQVSFAHNGQEAVDFLATQTVDLVLMDMQMPVMGGLEATRLLRERGSATVPVIAMTANAFADDRQKCLSAGMNDFLPKPVEPEVLYATLLTWLRATAQMRATAQNPAPAPQAGAAGA